MARSKRVLSREYLGILERYESRNVTHQDGERGWPLVWDYGRGERVWDVDGKEYLDLTAAFGVAACGHAHPPVVRAGREQLKRLPHAMGDVHPHYTKALLLKELSGITYERWGGWGAKTLLGNSGFEAVEAALKTACLATGRSQVIVFEGAYHGLGYGALNTTHRDHFVSPFRTQLREFGIFLPFPDSPERWSECQDRLEKEMKRGTVGAVLIEPIQARGGIREPVKGALMGLRKMADQVGALLIFDEIYTGFGRTGNWFACEQEGVVPDLICLGKALTGGFPLSACVGRAEIMDRAWPVSRGEAIHTSTFLGNPVGCAMALTNLKEIERLGLVKRSRDLGNFALEYLSRNLEGLEEWQVELKGRGLMFGMEVRDRHGGKAWEQVLEWMFALLKQGFIFLPEGDPPNVLGWTPPLIIRKSSLKRSLDAVLSLVRSPLAQG